MVRRFLILMLVLAGGLSAGTRLTPYNWGFGGNNMAGTRNMNANALSQRYKYAINWSGLGEGYAAVLDSIYDYSVAQSYSPVFRYGPYASNHEINLLYTSYVDSTTPYTTRILDTTREWLYIYAKAYLDSVGIDVETLVVHIDDNAYSMSNIAGKGDGKSRSASSCDTLLWRKRRFWYQALGNTSADTMFYPAGVCWLANGENLDACKAIAYAYRRHFFDDSVAFGPGNYHYYTYYADNQYRDAYSPRMSSYTAINSATGGATAYMDWREKVNIGGSTDSNAAYFDNGIVQLDSVVTAVLDSVSDALGQTHIEGFANVTKFSVVHFIAPLRGQMNLHFENPMDYGKSWSQVFGPILDLADSMYHAYPGQYVWYTNSANIMCSPTPGVWNYDSTRIFLFHYGFMLCAYDTNWIINLFAAGNSNYWRDIFYTDFGSPVHGYTLTNTAGSGGTYQAVIHRQFNKAGVITQIVCRSNYSALDRVNDSVSVSLGGTYYEIDANADTNAVGVTSTYLKPYQAKFFTQQSPGGGPTSAPPIISNIGPILGFQDSTGHISFTATDDFRLNRVRCYIWLPDSVHETNDSVSIYDSTVVGAGTSLTPSIDYVWPDKGVAWIVVDALDDSTDNAHDSVSCFLYPDPNPDISSIHPTSGMKDSTDTVTATLTGIAEDYQLDSARSYVRPLTGDSITVGDTTYSPAQTTASVAFPYTWPDSGYYWLVVVATNESGQSGRDSVHIHVEEDDAPAVTSILPASGWRDSTDAITATVTDDYGITNIVSYLWNPAMEVVGLWDSTYSPASTSENPSHDYTWPSAGWYYLVFVAIDTDGQVTRDSSHIYINQVNPVHGVKGQKAKGRKVNVK